MKTRTTTIEITDEIYYYLRNELRKGNKVKATTVYISILPEDSKDIYKPTNAIVTDLTIQK